MPWDGWERLRRKTVLRKEGKDRKLSKRQAIETVIVMVLVIDSNSDIGSGKEFDSDSGRGW